MDASTNNPSYAKSSRLTSAKWGVFVVFTLFLAVFFLLILILPKHEGELSPNERRMLAKAPDASFSSILHGHFSDQVTTWFEDHFPLRTSFVALYSYLNRYTGRNAVESIVLGSNDRLFTSPIAVNDTVIGTNVEKLSSFIDKNSLNAHTYFIPTSACILEPELPKLHLEYHDDEILDKLESALSEKAEAIPVRDIFKGNSDPSSLYYRTDHHLTMKGSYVSYVEIAKHLGITPLGEDEFTKTGYEFYGTAYGRSGLFSTPADTLETWVGGYDESLTVTTIEGSTETVHRGSLDTDSLKEDVVDKYKAYLYSNHGITRIVNDSVSDGALLVLKDSYGNAIVPFLAAHYHTIIMVDTRYYTPSLPSPSELCAEYGIKDFIAITGLDTVAESTLDWLR